MNILLVNTLYTPYKIGGAEKSVQLLAEALVKKGHKVSVLTLSHSIGFNIINEVEVYTLKLSNIYWPFSEEENSSLAKSFWHLLDVYNPLMNNEILKVLDTVKPELVHVNNLLGFSPHIWRLVKSRGIKIIHTLRDYYLMCPYTTMVKNGLSCKKQCFECNLYSIGKQYQSNNVDALVGISNYILNKHIDFGYFSNINIKKVIGNPVDCAPKLKSNLDSKLNDKIIFGYIGRIEKSKGVELLLNAFGNLESDNYKLRIAGKGSTTYVERLIKEYNSENIEFLGYVDGNEFYKGIDYLIVPSISQEPFGRVIIEANSFGVPVIGASSGGIEELIESGVNGLLFDPENPTELEDLLNIILNEEIYFESNKIIKKASNFEPGKVAKQYEDLYRELIISD